MKLETPFNTLIAGSTQTGKSFLARKLLREGLMDEHDRVIICSPTAGISGDWDEFQTKKNKEKLSIFTEPDQFVPVVQELINDTHKLAELYGKKRLPKVLLLIDDCLGHPVLRRDGPLDRFTTASRHFKVSIWVLIQKITGIPRTMRCNTRYGIFFSATNFGEVERLLSEYVVQGQRREFVQKLEAIYDVKYNFVLTDNYEPRLSKRIRVNGEKYLHEVL